MKADERKQIETNSLVLAVQKIRQHATGRTWYYVIGTVALVLGAIFLYRYFAGQTQRTRDEVLRQLAAADTAEKLKDGMEQHRGTMYGSLFKLHLARHHLDIEGLPRLGSEGETVRKQAAASVEQARTYFLELAGELKEKDEPGMVQDAWLGAAQAESALVGLPTAEGKDDSRGSADKVIEYYEKAARIFADKDFSKKYQERADQVKANKDRFVADQKALYRYRDVSTLSPPAPTPPGPLDKSAPPIPSLPFGPDARGPLPPPPPTPPADPKPADTPKGGDPKAK